MNYFTRLSQLLFCNFFRKNVSHDFKYRQITFKQNLKTLSYSNEMVKCAIEYAQKEVIIEAKF